MLPWTLSRRNSRMSRPDSSIPPANWANPQFDRRDLPAAKLRTTPQMPISFPGSSLGEGNMQMRFDALNRHSTNHPTPEVYYTEISWQGIVSPGLVAGRAQFCRDKRMQPKDLRLLESNFGGSSLSMRGESIIINTNGFRALIAAESVAILNFPLVPNGYSNSPSIQSGQEGLAFAQRQEFTSNLQKGISSLRREQRDTKGEEKLTYDRDYPFKLLALRSILDIIFQSLEQDLEVLKASIGVLLNTLEKEIRAKTMENLLVSTHRLQEFTGRCINLQNCLDKTADQSMQYLQDRKNVDLVKTFSGETEEEQSKIIHHTDLLTLIEQYSAEEPMKEATVMMKHLQMKEDTANLIINTNQLDLVNASLKLEVLAIGITLGALLTGIFGMNLKTGIEESDWAFAISTAVILAICGTVVVTGWVYVRQFGRNI